jgi:LysM repeat protein
MKPTTPRRTRRLLARAATMNQAAEEFDDYGPEPNMKLSHAFLVVLALHVVAVGGLYAFNTIKAGNRSSTRAEAKEAPVAQKGMPSGQNDSPVGGSQGSSGSDDQGGNKPPLGSKPAPVAKVSNQTQGKQSAEKPSQPSKGLLASARSMLRMAGTGGSAVAGTSKLAAQEPVPAADSKPPASAQQTYIVKAGDTVTKIASSLGVTIPDLEKVNGLAGNAVLQVGQSLKVPAQAVAQAVTTVQTEAVKVGTSAAKLPAAVVAAVSQSPSTSSTTVESATPSATAEVAGGSQYTVVKGDNPWKIAKRFKISQEELMKANGITDPKKIQIGQVLKIPVAVTPSKARK